MANPLVFGQKQDGRVQGFIGGLNEAMPPHRLDTSEAAEMQNCLPTPMTLWRRRWGSVRTHTSAAAAAYTSIIAPVGTLRVQHIGAGSLGDEVLVFTGTKWYREAAD